MPRKRKRAPYDGVVALGCVIQGETYHFELVSNESARGLMDLSVNRQLAIGNGILTVDNEAQALARSTADEPQQGRRRRARGARHGRAQTPSLTRASDGQEARRTRDDKDARKANKRGAARLAAVQALYQMDIAGTGLNEILAEFESHWLGREVEGAQYLPAEAAFFRDIVSGVVREQRKLDPLIDEALAKSWPLKRIEAVLRAALRAGAYELDHRRDVPARVVVSEYADVAAAFVERDETGMVNAVLDQLARKLRAAEFRLSTSLPLKGEGCGEGSWPCVTLTRTASQADLSLGGGEREDAMNSANDKLSGEDRLIARFFQPIATHPGALGLSDDAAFITPPPGCDLVLKTDAIIGGVHFFADDAARDVARKALRVNLSDLAAKGAAPLGFLLSLALPKEIGDDWLAGFRRRPARRRGAVRLSAVRRRHRPHAGADHDFHRHVRQRAGRQHGAPRRRQAGRPRVRERHHRRRRARAGAAQRRAGWKLSDAQRQHLAVALSAAAAAQCAGGSRAHPCLGGDGCVRRAGRRFRQAVPGLARWRPRSRWRACRCPMRPRPCLRPSRPCSRPRSPAATTTRSSAPCRRPRPRVSAPRRRRPRCAVTEIGQIEAGEGARFLGADGKPLVFQARLLQPLLKSPGRAAPAGV